MIIPLVRYKYIEKPPSKIQVTKEYMPEYITLTLCDGISRVEVDINKCRSWGPEENQTSHYSEYGSEWGKEYKTIHVIETPEQITALIQEKRDAQALNKRA